MDQLMKSAQATHADTGVNAKTPRGKDARGQEVERAKEG
jgi:hypothetical protein